MAQSHEALAALLQSSLVKQQEVLARFENVKFEKGEEDVLAEKLASFADLQQKLLENQSEIEELINQTRNKEKEESCGDNGNSVSDDSDSLWGTVVEAVWTKELSGGCMNHPTWRKNPQILLKVENEGEITLHLTQKPADDEDTEGVGFYVFNGKNYKELITTNGSAVARSSFSRNETISCTFSLAPSSDGYVILPCTFNPDIQMNFSVRIEAGETGSTIRSMTPDDKYTEISLTGEWKDKSAGGCRNFATWIYNPQYFLKVEKPTLVNLLLTQSEHEDFDAVGLYVFKAPSDECRSKIVPELLVEKGPFGNSRECSLSFQAESSCIIVPCTFHAEKESSFTLNFFVPSDSNASVTELLDTKEVSIDGEWNEQNAGGSTSYPTWRKNPQFVIRSSSRSNLTLRLVQRPSESGDLHPIGMYAFKDTGKRRLLVRPSDVISSTPCCKHEAIDLKIPGDVLDEKETGVYSCVIMPCTFYPDLCGKFSLSVAVSSDAPELPRIGSYTPFYQQSLEGAWTKETSGGCLNNGESWRDNPQFQLKALADTKLMLVLNLPNSENDTKHSIGFYITEGCEDGHKNYSLVDSILKKAPFRKAFEAYCPFSVREGRTYNIIPCTFYAGIESNFTFSVFSNQENAAILSPVMEHKKLSVAGSWSGDTAGGCLNNDTWCMNPRFAVCVTDTVKATFVLVQKSESGQTGNEVDLKPIGLYISRSDENLDPLLTNPEDLIASSPFEIAVDVSLPVTLQESKQPYLLVPSTFYPGSEGDFEIFMYLTEKEASSIVFKPILSIEEGDEPQVEVVETLEVDNEEKEEDVEEQSEEMPIDETESIQESVADDVEENPRDVIVHCPCCPYSKTISDTGSIPPTQPLPVQEEPKPEPFQEVTAPAETSQPPNSSADIPAPPVEGNVPPPPVLTKKRTTKTNKPRKQITKTQSEPVDVFKQIQEGKFLRKVTPAQKTSYTKRFQTEMFKGFNMEKIIARRTAIETISDDEGDDWSDHDDEEDWW